jgi:hypothetical protein
MESAQTAGGAQPPAVFYAVSMPAVNCSGMAASSWYQVFRSLGVRSSRSR